MINNDILRRLRYAFDFKDSTVIDIFSMADVVVTEEQVADWLKREEDEGFLKMRDKDMLAFLNGLIIYHRGKREGAPPMPAERLNNNVILQKTAHRFELSG